MRRVASVVGRRPWFCIVALCVSATFATGCGESVAADSACGNLEYGEAGPTRKEYLPCAGEMIATLDELAPQSQAALRGDQRARSDGQATLRRLQALMSAAGGRKLLERWKDRALTDLNMDIQNASTKYQAFYMVRILEPPDRYAATTREAAAAELSGATRRYDEARSLYRRLR